VIASPFGARSTALEVVEGHDLRGRDAIVTGAASGIGIETARALAAAGAGVTLAVRDRAKGEAVARDLRASTGNQKVWVGELDLASIASVRRFANAIHQQQRPLHLLINNAGIMATPQAYTMDGFESQFGTNHLGHFALTIALLPLLQAANGARVVSLSSSGHQRSDVHFEDPNYRERAYDPWDAYGQSKTANVLFAVGLTARHASDGIVANAVMPGGIMTGLQKFVPHEEQVRMKWIDADGNPNPRFKTPEQGASTTIWAAVGSELDGVGGLYLEDCAQAAPFSPDVPYRGVKDYALDPASADRLWELSEAAVT
jgi:NAD(P)-dependent dehydrogenase (short-subunit alcohol dehydrogenase family)